MKGSLLQLPIMLSLKVENELHSCPAPSWYLMTLASLSPTRTQTGGCCQPHWEHFGLRCLAQGRGAAFEPPTFWSLGNLLYLLSYSRPN